MRRLFPPLPQSLRAKISLGVVLPILLVMVGFSWIHYVRETRLVRMQSEQAALQRSQIVLGSLQHALLLDDKAMLEQILVDVADTESVERVQLIDSNAQVKAGNAPHAGPLDKQASGCVECHRFPPETRPRATYLSAQKGTFRTSALVDNAPACQGCHAASTGHLGVLLVDVSMVQMESHIRGDLQLSLIISLLASISMAFIVYRLIHFWVVQRVEAFRGPLHELSGGDFSVRMPLRAGSQDELDALAAGFNQLARQLEAHAQKEKENAQVRHRAIVEERERIARELHDGLAQVLGYVNTKAMAVRLMLQHQRIEAASQHLHQLEEAARALFIDTRETILGLKIAGSDHIGLGDLLEDFIERFDEISSLPVELRIFPEHTSLSLPPETEIQILRIVQEALTNVRKHADATQAWVTLTSGGGILDVQIEDNGRGFEPAEMRANGRAHFGLAIMRERAEAIGATFEVRSANGRGTLVTLHLPAKEISHARSGSR